MKTAISLPDETFARVEAAAAKLGVSRSEFFRRAADSLLREMDGADLTEAINRSLEGVDQEEESAFVRMAAHRLAASGLLD